jgi:primosomal protein N' (replication factor Y)
VVLADVGLGVPDFRAGERTFQLLYQVAGRSGRGAVAGRVIVQTYQPDNYAIKAAAAQDYRRFYSQEIDLRKEHRNPPFSRLVRLLYSHVNGAKCERESVRLCGLLSDEQASWGLSDVEILGPTPAHPARVRGHYRWQLVLRGADPRVLLDKVTVPHGWDVDVDPVGLG